MLLWDPRYRVGIPELDSQHLIIFGLLGQIDGAATAGTLKDIAGDILNGLRAFAAFHLRFEEVLMERIGYPGLEEHVREHEVLMEMIEGLIENGAQDEARVMRAKDLIRDWFVGHIFTSDAAIGDFVNAGNGKASAHPDQASFTAMLG